MSVKVNELKPYKSLILAKIPDTRKVVRTYVNSILDDMKELLGLADKPERILNEKGSTKIPVPGDDGKNWAGFFHYEERRKPSWYAGGDEFLDITNELFLVFQRERHIGIYLSDTGRRSVLGRRLGDGEGNGLGVLAKIERGMLNAAYVQGPTRTMWLSAIHAPVTVKANTKTLSGIDLRDALDPLDDQTYHFTSARSSVPKLNLPIGVSPRGSRIWIGSTPDWSEFIQTTSAVLKHLSTTTEPDLRPLPVLAVESTKTPTLEEIFEIHFIAPELLSDSPDIEPEEKEIMERWAYRADFEIKRIVDPVVSVEVALDGLALASISLELDASDPENVEFFIHDVKRKESAKPEDIRELMKVCNEPSWFKVWYESGHAIANGAIFEIRHRDEPFEKFKWIDLSGYDAKKEKFWSGKFPPNAVDTIGTTDSLFCWVKNHFPIDQPGSGWLVCDDGAMEIADFIHLDELSDPPVLSLIHVKGAKNNEDTRGISVASYEVVVGQAVKNLRYLDRIYLDQQLESGLGKMISELVWHDGIKSTREEMLEALLKIGTSFKRSVVVLQPHVMKSKVAEVRLNENHKDAGRLRQLDTLLHGAQASSRDLSAQFVVYGEKR